MYSSEEYYWMEKSVDAFEKKLKNNNLLNQYEIDRIMRLKQSISKRELSDTSLIDISKMLNHTRTLYDDKIEGNQNSIIFLEQLKQKIEEQLDLNTRKRT
jgi:hypothetical protein